jgi:hypothetical protein
MKDKSRNVAIDRVYHFRLELSKQIEVLKSLDSLIKVAEEKVEQGQCVLALHALKDIPDVPCNLVGKFYKMLKAIESRAYDLARAPVID